MLQHPGIEFACVGERCAYVEGDVEKPLAAPRLGQAGSTALAVVEDVRHLMHHEIGCWIGFAEVHGRYETDGSSLNPTSRLASGSSRSTPSVPRWRLASIHAV